MRSGFEFLQKITRVRLFDGQRADLFAPKRQRPAAVLQQVIVIGFLYRTRMFRDIFEL
jgi:hypothetical protein